LRQDLDPVIKATQKAATLTGQLLAFCRAQVLNPRVLDLNASTYGMESVRSWDRGHGASRLVPKYLASPATILADASQVEQVIMNLVVNARDAMPNGGRLVVETGNELVTESGERTEAAVKPGRYRGPVGNRLRRRDG